MKHTALILMLAASALAASAQTTAKPAAPAAKPATAAAKPTTAATAAKTATPAVNPLIAPKIEVPDNKCGEDFCIPHHKGLLPQKPLSTIALRYQEIKVGDGPVAEPNKLYKIQFTEYRAADGVKIDSSLDRPGQPLKDKDGKPILGDDGKPKLDAPQALPFPQGQGAFIIGFDQGLVGMRIHGQRRIFIPWQLGYGTHTIPDRPGHAGIPAKSDLIFDVELVDVTDIPAPPVRPNMPMGGRPMGPNGQAMPPKPGAPGTPGAPMMMMTTPKPAAPPAPSTAPKPMAPIAPPPAPATAPATPAQPQP